MSPRADYSSRRWHGCSTHGIAAPQAPPSPWGPCTTGAVRDRDTRAARLAPPPGPTGFCEQLGRPARGGRIRQPPAAPYPPCIPCASIWGAPPLPLGGLCGWSISRTPAPRRLTRPPLRRFCRRMPDRLVLAGLLPASNLQLSPPIATPSQRRPRPRLPRPRE